MKVFSKTNTNLITIVCILCLILKVNAQECVYVHTDKSAYITGEVVKFKAYLLNIKNSQLTNSSKIIYFQLTGGNKTELSGLRANLENGTCNGEIELSDSLASGYYYLSAFTNNMRNYPIQTCFNKKILVINQNDERLDSIIDFSFKENLSNQKTETEKNLPFVCKLSTEKNIYGAREKVNLKIQFDSLLCKTGNKNLSVCVAQQSPFEDTSYSNNIISYLAEIKNEWKHLQNESYSNSCKFLTEKNAYIFSGEVLSKTNQSALNKVKVLLSTTDSIANLQYFETDKSGKFYFQLNKYYDNKTLYLQLSDSFSIPENYKFNIDNRKINPSISNISKQNLNYNAKNYITISQKLALINKIYNPNHNYEFDNKSFKINSQEYPFYGMPDEVIIPADFEEMHNFGEMTRNYIWVVKFRKSPNAYSLNMIDYELRRFQDENTFLLINSIPVFNFEVLEPLNTLTIQKIEIRKKHVIYGEYDLYGVLSIFMNEKLASKIYTNLEIPIFQNKVMKTFVNPNLTASQFLELQKNKDPDFRQILYWNPQLTVDKNNESNIEFYTSDLKTKYIIQVQGIADDKIPVYAKYIIEVK